ncbi:hypothetical protein [Microvirga aerophila]|uniref:Uncharacterized protein n=1 Tax=Microvirga aerophila TaxID=670291 RepID=A0A512BZK8_9HYPH|nr:hypothetical protein [Microvirga aerophila]GEO17395.1 hypothetical protein MAE02_50910 [Microvirga aerophila]
MIELNACNFEEKLRPYFDIDPYVQRADCDFFINNRKRTHFIRKPYPGEIREGCQDDANLIVVRKHAPDTFQRRAFWIEGSGEASLLRAFHYDDEEILARAFWAAWDAYEGEIALTSDVVNMTVKAFDDIEKLPPPF